MRLSARVDEGRHEQISAARDEVAVLLSLLLGFTLALALQHIDYRRELVVDEADAISTASLRAQVLPEPYRGKVLELLREYVGARLAYSSAGKGPELDETLARTKKTPGPDLGTKPGRGSTKGLTDQCDLPAIN